MVSPRSGPCTLSLSPAPYPYVPSLPHPAPDGESGIVYALTRKDPDPAPRYPAPGYPAPGCRQCRAAMSSATAVAAFTRRMVAMDEPACGACLKVDKEGASARQLVGAALLARGWCAAC